MTKLFLILACFFSFSFAQAASFKLTSTSMKPGKKMSMDQVFNSFGCSGKNISPELKWSGAPKGTKSFALTMYDPDAPTGSGWWHWVVFNIPADATGLPANASADGNLPKGAMESRTDFGKPGYGGPCPPPGKPHHYVFTLYALKDNLQLDQDASGAMAGFNINQAKIASTKLTVMFGR